MYTASDIDALNARFATATPQEVISYAIAQASKAIITTNFRPYEGALLHAVTQVAPQLPVVWCDSGYNTKATYTHAQELIETLDLQIDLYVPKQTRAHRDILMGIPSIDDPQHAVFTEQVKCIILI